MSFIYYYFNDRNIMPAELENTAALKATIKDQKIFSIRDVEIEYKTAGAPVSSNTNIEELMTRITTSSASIDEEFHISHNI
ncbi:hypothetical protein BGZ80_001853 [Entomortierella chlamydospora]|uniref:Uncharacterized protein n=1 Tax=Entomortierella chlamydospora TaxID=101097 RepID=A0A9P6SXH9_9FUNG|nr:hypothetical protein BGZ80_001853 [Entomortierella chlamydospora]